MSHRCILLIFIGICSILCSAKKNFEIILERADIYDLDPEIIHATASVNKYNRTCKALYLNFTLVKDLLDATVEIQLFALYSNEYRPTLVKFKRNLCDLFKYEYLWFKSEMVKTSNIPTQCPLLAGDYYLKDFVPNGAAMPAAANLPWTKVLIRLQFLCRGKVASTFKLYLTLDHDAELKRVG